MTFTRIILFSLVIYLLNSAALYSQNLNLRIQGKDSLENKTIDSLGYKTSFIDFNSLKDEIEALHLKIQKLGYIENKLVSTKKKNDSTYLTTFSLNKKYHTIYIYYDKKLILKEILDPVSSKVTSEYFVTTISKIENLLNYLNTKLIENGHPFASLKLINLKKKDENNIEAELIVTNDKKRSIDNIVVKGYESFPKSYIKHFLKIRTRDAFNLNYIKE